MEHNTPSGEQLSAATEPRGLARSVLARARRTPAATAVVDGDQVLDYAALDAASAAVAAALRDRGVRPRQAVAVCLPRSWQLVCVMLGVLRVGAVVVPLDVQSPPGRRRHILEDSASTVLVHGGSAPGELPPEVAPLAASELLREGPVTGDEPDVPADAPVSFLFYTSGTTGRPKGVEVRDAGILRLARPGYLALDEGARYSCLSNPAFDALSFEVWVPLLTGGCCVILDDETVQTPHLLAEALLRERVDTVWVTVALFNAVVGEEPACFAGARQVLVGGEQLNARLIARWYRHNESSPTRLHNVYGPTETTTFAFCHPVPRDFDGDVVPIGRPLPDTGAVLVADGSAEGSRAAAPGEVAELYLSGDGLAAGYRNLPDETESRFVHLPWLDGGQVRHYRTGDLVRQDGSGLVVYVGRADRQVKVRGFRIEPGELERHLVAHPAVRQAYVCTRRDAELGTNELLAYVVLGAELSYEDVDRHLSAGLPPYMRPHRIFRVDALPLNANGKVDQGALLADDREPWRPAVTAAGPSATAWEREVLDLAGGILGVPDLRPDDRWIPHGGDSLKALRLRFEVRRLWGRELAASVVLRSTFAELAAAIAPGPADDAVQYPPVPPPAGARSAPATSEQQRLWLLQQRDPESRAYSVPLAFQLDGAPDLGALREALRRSVTRHPALRTGFRATPEGLYQEVAEAYDPWVGADASAEPDTDGWRGPAQRFFAEPFDLAEPRMLRVRWLPESNVLLLHLHHIAVDGWSLSVLFREVSADYAAVLAGADAEMDGTPRDHASVPTPLDFAAWQAEWFTRQPYRDQRAALRAHYETVADVAAPLPVVRERERPAGRLLHTTLDLVRRSSLDRLGAELGLTRFQLLLGVFAWSLYGVTGRAHPLIASPVANRPVREFEAGVGMFANTVLLPLTLAPRDGLRAQLLRQGAAAQAVLDRQDVVLADALADHPFRAEGPPFDFMFVLENTEFGALALPGREIRPVWPRPVEAKCALTLSVVEHEAGFDCLWEYADDHFDSAEVEAVARLFREGLDRLDEGGTDTLGALVAPYRRGLADAGRGPSARLAFTTVAEGFARQVRRTPTAPAVTTGGRMLSYAELDAHASALATEVRDRYALSPDDTGPCCVALHLGPSPEHVVAVLALARLNVTIVPLDPAYPPALLRQILDQVDPLCVLLSPGGEAELDAVAPAGLPRHPVTLATEPAPAAPWTPHDGRRPLYTLFTSGSTGTPKGVRVPDRTLCNLLQWQSDSGGLGAPAVTQQFSMLSFDVSFQEIFTTLCGGGHLRLVRPEWRHDAPALLDELESGGVERLFLPYVALQLLAEHGAHLGRFPSRLREVITAGEQLVCTDAIRRWFAGLPGARLFNHYGPTETHVVSGFCLEGDPADWPARPAIGRPVADAWLRVVDDAGEAVPPGCPGDLLIGGPMAAPCYLGDEELNRTRFTELPGLCLFYRTGDQARFDRDGVLHYLGRDDQQIKLSGHRLELGQVEAALLQHPAIVNAVVLRDGDDLVACLQCRDTTPTPSPDELAGHLASLLPAYVRIARFRRMRTPPRTPSGKLDRRAALTTDGEDLRAPRSGVAELSPREARLTALFEAVTGKRVAPGQRFFDAGATSLDLMRFHLRCTAGEGLRFTIPDLFEHVTIRALARFVDGGPSPADAAAHEAAAVASDEPVAVVGMAVRLPGADDLAAFWALVESGGRGIEHFDAADGLVGARSLLDGPLAFDPGRFGISRQEARLMDPQQRHLLMSCVAALAHAGITDPAARRVGLIASCGEDTYFQAMLREGDPAHLPDGFQLALHHEKDFLATKAAYHLGLTGPAFTVQAACASSLVGVHVAAGLLRQGDAEVMLAGGVLVDTQLSGGYRYRPQHIFSRDGHCRPFSDDASGTVGASGVGVVVLKPLRLAERDGDTVYAVITGSALNNDGAGKLGYAAPSLAGQREVIRTALRRSGRTSADLGYVEAHGTGTPLGDPVEVGALRQAFDLAEPDRCALASVKSQIGHLGAAAGVVGLVRATLAVHHGVIPPNVDFHRINPRIGDDLTPFHIPTKALAWPEGRPRVAAVSSFGIGGTNAHLVLERRQSAEPRGWPATVPCLVLSGGSTAALRADAARIADHLAARPETYEQVLRHLQAGRPALRRRAASACADAGAAVTWLREVAAGDDELSALGETTPSAASDLPGVADTGPEGGVLAAGEHPAETLAAAWTAGRSVRWPDGPAQAPWDFPPPAFDLSDHTFARATPGTTGTPSANTGTRSTDTGSPSADAPLRRLPESDWLHQPGWVRLRRAGTGARTPSGRLLVVLTATPSGPETWRAFEPSHTGVIRVSAADRFARLAEDRYEVDPADPDSLRQLLDALEPVARGGVDWLHALPLAVEGAVDERTLARARWACLDTSAALLRALAGAPASPDVRVWWVSYGAQPVEGPVRRPELGLLAGAGEVVRQETGVTGHWLDLPGSDPAGWAAALPMILAEADAPSVLPRRLALRDGYWWHQTVQPVGTPAAYDSAQGLRAGGTGAAEAPGVQLILGGTGGIGASVASWLLERTDCRVVLLARRPQLPETLARWGDRVDLVEGDLAEEPADVLLARLAPRLRRLRGIVHAAGTAAGGLIVRRDARAMRHAMAAKLRGALLMERLIADHRPAYAAYCSSMATLFGGVGQLDYAAANGVLDGFARYRADDTETTLRIGIGWDVWREVGMARDTLHADARHQAHVAVGLTVEEGRRVFGHALELQLPQLMVSTTAVDRAHAFYEPGTSGASAEAAATTGAGPARETAPPVERLTEVVCRLLGLDSLDPTVSLYDLGADSLTLLDLISEIKRLYDVELELFHLSHQVTLDDLLALLDRSPDTPSSDGPSPGDPVGVEVWQAGTGRDLLCLVHPVGGDIQAYRALVSALEPGLTVCLIADPALLHPELPAWSVTERAARYHAALEARFPHGEWRWRLAGWSFGAWVALSMAAEAEAAGRPAAELYLLDPPSPGAGPALAAYDEEEIRAVFAHELAQADGRGPAGGDGAGDSSGTGEDGGRSTASREATAYAERLAHRCRANLATMRDHEPPRLTRTPSALWLASESVPGLPSPESPESQARAWRAYLPDPSRWECVESTHYDLVKPPHVKHVAEAVNSASLPAVPDHP
ncbi:amino acid adenylation domain-containing protein [Streptomyces sp. NPDC006638]|uniref:amino acid adenylation domain-containing protein n=1 Tax=Streptomyces sp. NPDC006638 TaxID=3157183 RepID=UPI0033A85A1E